MENRDIKTTVESLARELLGDGSLFLVDIGIRGSARTPIVDVFIDGDDGVSIDQCADVSRNLYRLLEESDGFIDNFVLNVSSPGLNKPLVKRRQFARHLGRRVRVELASSDDTPSTIEGLLVEARDNGVTVDSGGSRNELLFEEISEAVVTPSFKKPGSKR